MAQQPDIPQEEVVTKHGSFWQEAVPLPLYTHNWLLLPRLQCPCGKKFKKESDYEHHFRREHIIER